MKGILLLPFAAALTLMAMAQNPGNQPAQGQQQNNPQVNDAENRTGFWDCSVPGGNYTIGLGKISSVGIHEYAVTGGRVTELVVDTEGSVCARFYYMEAANVGGNLAVSGIVKERLNDVLEQAADRTGTDKVWRKVQKDYPLATHAHTVDFRLQSLANLQAIHGSVKGAWMSGRGRTIRIVE